MSTLNSILILTAQVVAGLIGLGVSWATPFFAWQALEGSKNDSVKTLRCNTFSYAVDFIIQVQSATYGLLYAIFVSLAQIVFAFVSAETIMGIIYAGLLLLFILWFFWLFALGGIKGTDLNSYKHENEKWVWPPPNRITLARFFPPFLISVTPLLRFVIS